MRIIYDKHLMIIRGIDIISFNFFKESFSKYPNKTLIVCKDKDIGVNTPIQFVYERQRNHIFNPTFGVGLSDDKVIAYYLSHFPPYDEDSDPEVSF